MKAFFKSLLFLFLITIAAMQPGFFGSMSVASTAEALPIGPSSFFVTTTAYPENAGIVQITPAPNFDWPPVFTDPTAYEPESVTPATNVNETPVSSPDGYYWPGTVVTRTAIPTGTNKFYGWSGSATGTNNPLTQTITTNNSVTAFFTDSSLVWQHTSRRLATWFMNGANLLGSMYLNSGKPLTIGWKLVTAYDFNADGSKDFLFQHANGSMAIWFMDRNNLRNSMLIESATAGWRAVGVSDFNDDGKWDILFQHTDGRLAVWFMEGVIRKSAVLLNRGMSVSPAWRAVGIKKVNSDNQGDIIFQHTNGQIVVWFMNKTTFLQAGLPNPGAKWRVTGVNDFNSDNKTDLVLQDTGGRLAVWFMDGTSRTGLAYLNGGQPVTGWKIGAVK